MNRGNHLDSSGGQPAVNESMTTMHAEGASHPAAVPRAEGGPSPVEQILAMGPQGGSLLDSRPAGAAIPKWMWLLPLILALPGGIVAWLLVRESNRTGAWVLLGVGVATTVLTVLSIGPTSSMLSSLGM
jgi:hypothetical protein